MREQIKDRTLLERIINAINKVLAFTEGKTYSDLANETMLFYAVVKNVEIIGEAAYHITKAFCKAHPKTE